MPLTVSQHKHIETKGAYAQHLGLLNRNSRTEVSCTTECEFENSCLVLFGFPIALRGCPARTLCCSGCAGVVWGSSHKLLRA